MFFALDKVAELVRCRLGIVVHIAGGKHRDDSIDLAIELRDSGLAMTSAAIARRVNIRFNQILQRHILSPSALTGQQKQPTSHGQPHRIVDIVLVVILLMTEGDFLFLILAELLTVTTEAPGGAVDH